MNKVIFSGNLANDPAWQKTQSGVSVCRFRLAVNRRYKAADGVRATDFFEIVCWRELADNCKKYLQKGRKVLCEGEMQTGNYTDRDGVRRYTVELIADNVEFLSHADGQGDREQGQYDCDRRNAVNGQTARTADAGSGSTESRDAGSQSAARGTAAAGTRTDGSGQTDGSGTDGGSAFAMREGFTETKDDELPF